MATNLGTPQNWSPAAPSGGLTVQDLMNQMRSGGQQTVDLNSLMPRVTSTQRTSPFTASMFQSTPLVQQAQQSAHQGIMGLLGDIGHALSPIGNEINGAFKGWNSNLDGGGFQGMIAGLENPQAAVQAHQQFVQNAQNSESNPVMKWLTGAIQNTAASPISYIPGTVVAKPLGMVSNAIGLTPAAKFLADLVKGTVKGGAEAGIDGGKAFDEAVGQATPKSNIPIQNPTPVSEGGLLGFLGDHTPQTQPAGQGGLLGLLGNEPTTIANIAKPGMLKTTAGAANDLLGKAMAKASETGLSPGREFEQLQGALSSVAPKTGTSLDNLINAVNPKDITPNINNLIAKNVAGITAKDMAPQVFKQGTKDVIKPLTQDTTPATEGALQKIIGAGNPMGVANQSLPGGLLGIAGKGQSIADILPALEGASPEVQKLMEEAMHSASASPYAKYAWQSKIGAPMANFLMDLTGPDGNPIAQKVLGAVRGAVTALPGTTAAFKNAFSQYFGDRSSLANERYNTLENALKDATPEERNTIHQLLESVPPGTPFNDPRMESLRQPIEDILNKYLQQGKNIGVISKEINPTDFGVARYLSHIPVGRYDPFQAADNEIINSPFLRKSIDMNKDRTLKGTIQDLNQKAFQSKGASPEFETDIAKILGHYMGQIDDATAAHNFITKAMDNASKYTGDIHPETNTEMVPFEYQGRRVLMPKAEAKILSNLGDPVQENGFSKGYRGLTNIYNKMMFAGNPLMHVVNNLGFQTAIHNPMLFKSVLGHIPEALSGIKPGSEMDRALKAGALNLSSEIGARGSHGTQVEKLIDKLDGTGFANTKAGKMINGYNKFTPNVEKAYRTAAFMDAVKKGMSDEDAAKYVRSIFGGHMAPNTASGIEKSLGYLFPFVNWTKTALASNAKNALTNPRALLGYSLLGNLANSANELATGHGLMGNQNPNAVGEPGKTNAQGFQQYFTPYFPAWDLEKLGTDMASQGAMQGGLNFAWSRLNPQLKTAIEILSKNQNPFAETNNQYQLVQYPHLAGGANNPANARGMFFGNEGPAINPYWSAVTQNMPVPFVPTAVKDASQPLNQSLWQLLNGITGGSVSAPNPQGPAKEAAYNQRMAKSEERSAAKAAAKKAAQKQAGG